MRHFPEEAGDTDDGGRAGAGGGGDLAIGLQLLVQQPRHRPALRKGAEFRGGAQVREEGVQLLARLQAQQGVIEGEPVVGRLVHGLAGQGVVHARSTML